PTLTPATATPTPPPPPIPTPAPAPASPPACSTPPPAARDRGRWLGTGQPDQAWGQPEPDWEEPDPNWGPPDDDDWMPNEDPWNTPPQDSAATQQSAPQQPAPVEQPSSPEPGIATGPEPVASDGYAGFIPRNEPTDEPAIPAFAKSEAELRQEFQRRFGDVIPGSSGKKPQQDSPKPAS